MFQFSTTNVINSLKYLDGSELLFIKDNVLIIKGRGQFNKENITAIYEAVAQDHQLEKVEYTLAEGTLQKGEVYRLNIYVGLSQGSADSAFANDLSFKGKPFSVEFVCKENPTATLEALVKTIDKYEMLVYDDKILDVKSEGSKLTISATNEYQRFKNISIEKFEKNASDYPYGGDYKEVLSFENIKGTNDANFTAGSEGVGTYSYLLHNVRIPTDARTRAFAPNSDEAPVLGAKYDQYTIHYCVNRGPLGLNAVGDAVKSVTTHVFFVNSDISANFKTALKKLVGDTIITQGIATSDETTGDSKTANPGSLEATALAAKQDKLIAGDGINIDSNKVSVKYDSTSLEVGESGLKVKA